MILVVLLMVLVRFVSQPVGGFLHVLVLLLFAIGVAVHHSGCLGFRSLVRDVVDLCSHRFAPAQYDAAWLTGRCTANTPARGSQTSDGKAFRLESR